MKLIMSSLSMMSALASKTIFVGNLSIIVQEHDLYELFISFGFIESIEFKRTNNDRDAVSYCFVKFTEHEMAESALNSLNGRIFLGKPLRMGWAREFDSSGRPIMSNEEYSSRLRTYSPPTAQIHISFRAMKPFPLNEAYLREIFQTFGEVIDVVIKKVQLRPDNHQTGYGFIHYALTEEGIQAAVQAAQVSNCKTIDGVFFKTELSHGLLTLLQQQQQPPLRRSQELHPLAPPTQQRIQHNRVRFSQPPPSMQLQLPQHQAHRQQFTNPQQIHQQRFLIHSSNREMNPSSIQSSGLSFPSSSETERLSSSPSPSSWSGMRFQEL